MYTTWKNITSSRRSVRSLAGAATLTVPAGGDLQGVLNSAHPGDTVQIAAGATFTGHYYLLSNSGPTITIQSSAMGSLPGAGSRISPDQDLFYAKTAYPGRRSGTADDHWR